MTDGTDEDGTRAAVMDEWIIWEAEERVAPQAYFFRSISILFVRGLTPQDLRAAHL